MISLKDLKPKRVKASDGPKYRTLGIYIRGEVHEKLLRVCKHTGTGTSTVARKLLEDGLDRLIAELDAAR